MFIAGLNVVDLMDRKTKGTVTIVKVGDAHAVSSKKFDPNTGEALTPEIVALDLDKVRAERDALKAQVAAIDLFITEVEGI
jgi:hypothetical protein